MSNFNTDYSTEDPADYGFDASLIEWTISNNPKLKELEPYVSLSLYLRFLDNTLDSSLIGTVTTPTDITYASGLVDKVAIFNGTTSKVLLADTIWSGSGNLVLGISFYVKQTVSAYSRILEWENGKFFRIDIVNQNRVDLITAVGNISVTGLDLTVRTLVTVDMVENGTSNIYIDNVLSGTVSVGTLLSNASGQIYLGCDRIGTGSFFTGEVEQLMFKDDAIFTSDERAEIYNSGSGKLITRYSPDSPVLTQNTPSSDSQLVSFTSYSVTASGTGSIGTRLSDDNYVTSEYWNGSSWDSTGSSYNGESTVNTNISTFSATAQQISTKLAFVSDGFQQIELSDLNIGYAINTAPTIDAGADKPTGGQAPITDITSFTPYSDCSFTDSDGTVTNAYTSENGGAFVEILQGVYSTLLEAVQAYSFQASVIGVGTHTFTLKVEDNLGAESQDSVIITVTDSIADDVASILAIVTDTNTVVNATAVTSSNIEKRLINTRDINDYNLRKRN